MADIRTPRETPCGVLILDKPKGPTSHDVVALVRKALRTREVGHAGTLDPMATGILVVAVGEATKLVPYLTASDKEYVARLALGATTESLDAEGPVTQTESVATTVLEALATFQGTGVVSPLLAEALEKERARVEQVPPAVSAIKIDGQRAHELVRRGTVPTMAPRSVHVLQMTLVASGMADATSPWPWLDVHVRASKGYYVRSLGRDLASHLGTVGHLTALRRVRSGEFSLDEAVASHAPPDHLRQRMLSLTAAATRCLSHCTLDDASVVAAQRGQKVPLPPTAPKSGPAAWLDGSGNLVAIGETLAESSTALGRVLRGFRPIPATASPAQIAREGMGHGAGPHPERETERETEHEPVREYGDASSETPETSPRH